MMQSFFGTYKFRWSFHIKGKQVFNICKKVMVLGAFIAGLSMANGLQAFANPTDGIVVGGNATITNTPTELQINQTSNSALIEWSSFNIGAGETTRFIQPNASAVALNRVANSAQYSAIDGHLLANGRVFVINPNGVLIGSGAQVSTAGFIASTADIANDAFMNAGGMYNFDRPGNPQASIENKGHITVQDEGLAALVAPIVRNSGIIQGNLAKIQMAAGDTFGIDLYGDGLLHIAVNAPSGTAARNLVAENKGSIVADGGKVLMTAAAASDLVDTAINTSGVIQAHGIASRNGEIILTGDGADVKIAGAVDASGINGGKIKIGGDLHGQGVLAKADHVFIGPDAVVSADGGKGVNGIGNGGQVIVWANKENNFRGTIAARGGQSGGAGGFVEISTAKDVLLGGQVDASAPHGAAGMFLLDPATLNIRNGSGPVVANVVYENDVENTSVSGTHAVYAADTVTLENLSDNVLQGGSGDITLTGTGSAGKVIFDDLNDAIATTDGDLTITAGSGGIAAGSLRVNGDGHLSLSTSNGGSISTQNLTVNRVTGDSAILTVNSDGALNISGDVLVKNIDNSSIADSAIASATLISKNNMNVSGAITVSSYDHDPSHVSASSLLTMASAQGDIHVGGPIGLNSDAENLTPAGSSPNVAAESIAHITTNNGAINLAGGITANAEAVHTGPAAADAIVDLVAVGDITVNNSLRSIAIANSLDNHDRANALTSAFSTDGEIYLNMPNEPAAIASDAFAHQAYHGMDVDITDTSEMGEALDTARLYLSGLHRVNVIADPKFKVYGSADPALTYTASFNYPGAGPVPNNFFTGSLTRVPGENVAGGPYAILLGSLHHVTTSTGRYAINYTGNNLVITPATLTVIADPQVKTFGALDPPLTYTHSPLLLSDTESIFTGSLIRDPGEAVGSYAINQGALSAGSNYVIDYLGNILTIVPVPTPPPAAAAPTVLAPFFAIDPLGRPIISVENQVIVLDAPFEPIETLTLQTDVSIAAAAPQAAQLAQIAPAAGGEGGEPTAEDLASIAPAAGGGGGAAAPNSAVACANAFLDNRPCAAQ